MGVAAVWQAGCGPQMEKVDRCDSDSGGEGGRRHLKRDPHDISAGVFRTLIGT